MLRLIPSDIKNTSQVLVQILCFVCSEFSKPSLMEKRSLPSVSIHMTGLGVPSYTHTLTPTTHTHTHGHTLPHTQSTRLLNEPLTPSLLLVPVGS